MQPLWAMNNCLIPGTTGRNGQTNIKRVPTATRKQMSLKRAGFQMTSNGWPKYEPCPTWTQPIQRQWAGGNSGLVQNSGVQWDCVLVTEAIDSWDPQDVFNLLPNLNMEELRRSFVVKSNDMMLVIYLSSLVRSVLALHDLIDNREVPHSPIHLLRSALLNLCTVSALCQNQTVAATMTSSRLVCVFCCHLVCSMGLVDNREYPLAHPHALLALGTAGSVSSLCQNQNTAAIMTSSRL